MSETDDYIAIRRLQNRYADACSRRAWADVTDLFLPDATVTLDLGDRELHLDGAEALTSFVAAQLDQFTFFLFVIRNAVIDCDEGTDPDTASGRMWMSEIRQHADDARFSTIFGLYRDRYVRTPAGWRFARRHYRSLARPETGEVFPYADLPVDG